MGQSQDGRALLEATLLREVRGLGWGKGKEYVPFLSVREFQACPNTCKYLPILPTPTATHFDEGR